MTPPRFRVATTIAAAALATVADMHGPREIPLPPPAPVARAPVEIPAAADFVGAEACAACHPREYAAWSRSTHGRAGGRPRPELLIAPFTGAPIRFRDAVVTPGRTAGGGYAFTVVQSGRAPRVFPVDGVIGGGHMVGGGTQGFVTRHPDGTLRLLPFEFIRRERVWFCNTNSRANRGWIPITRDVALADCGDWPPLRVLGDVARFANCQGCHGSQIQVAFDPAAKRYETRLTSLAVNCESCHGAGRRHVAVARAGRIDATAAIGMRPLATLDKEGALGVCYQCHALKDRLAPGEYALNFPQLGDRPLLPDGRVRTFAYQENQRASDCYLNGAMKCTDCHDPHSQGYRDVSGAPLASRSSDAQCLGCHPSKEGAGAPEHTHHRASSAGSRCVACHMPYLQEAELGRALRYARSDHTVSIPRPVFDDSLGLESACAQCHRNRTAQALDDRVRAWYGTLKPHAAAVRGILSGALLQPGTGHPIAQFAGLAAYLERHLSPDMPAFDSDVEPRLRRLATDDDVDVRTLALASLHLARGREPGIRRFLAGRLATLALDEADAVRKRWAMALGFVADAYRGRGDPARAIVAYKKALEVAPGDPRILFNLGIALGEAGRSAEAIAAYQRSLAADSTQALVHVNWGLALEAQGDTNAAAARYRRALAIDPREPLAYFDLGALALAGGRPREAVPLFLQAAANGPSLAPAHFNLARAYFLLGDRARAARALEDGLEFDPGNEGARRALRDLARSGSPGH